MSFAAYGATRQQEGRSTNEDAFAILRDLQAGSVVAAVADGAGAAEQAGRRVLRIFERLVTEDGPAALDQFPYWRRWVAVLDSALLGGNQSTFLAVAGLAVEGTRGGRIVGACVGDSRAYLINRDGQVELITDSSSKARLGSSRAEPLPIHRRVDPGDMILLLTDGAWTPISSTTRRLGRSVMGAALRHLAEVPQVVLDEASRTGRADDMTAVVVRTH